jgi:hypothetical protein
MAMRARFWVAMALIGAGVGLGGCVPLVIGGAGAVVVDEAMEQKAGGGDGLF